jgi:hypothetical protein
LEDSWRVRAMRGDHLWPFGEDTTAVSRSHPPGAASLTHPAPVGDATDPALIPTVESATGLAPWCEGISDRLCIQQLVSGYGRAAFGQAATDFGSSDVTDGLQALLNGTNDYLVSVPDDLYIGTVDALTNEPVTPAIDFLDSAPANFADAVTDAQGNFDSGEGFFTMAATAFSAADYADAAYDSA